ncbi:HdeD family acid-resistance protein [Acinetobacter sp. NIPH 1852]|uniref:HdeD family acid-resistance protein n=1 Tax=Acinetobacter sp. NIPH 1852 TaxID=2923428 RepID=UPI001F4AF831|nr:HdeD family acid-resistance protein [Acinetobacter sp. NIPH 1852]MCH7308250.1 HdeD family acid-resistance protein [Acinetobacter sp. NIPH 1852]
MMKTVGNDLIRNQLHADRKWYLLLGVVLIIIGLVLLAALPFATLSAVLLFGVLMMLGGALHFLAAFMVFKGGTRWLWALFGVLYLIAGYFAFTTPVITAVVLTSFLAIALIIAGIIRTVNAFILRPMSGWGWVLFSGIVTLFTGVLILSSPSSPFWVLGMFLAIDILFQGINYLTFAGAIKQLPHSSTAV